MGKNSRDCISDCRVYYIGKLYYKDSDEGDIEEALDFMDYNNKEIITFGVKNFIEYLLAYSDNIDLSFYGNDANTKGFYINFMQENVNENTIIIDKAIKIEDIGKLTNTLYVIPQGTDGSFGIYYDNDKDDIEYTLSDKFDLSFISDHFNEKYNVRYEGSIDLSEAGGDVSAEGYILSSQIADSIYLTKEDVRTDRFILVVNERDACNKNTLCESFERFMRVGDITYYEGKEIMLINTGSLGDVIVDVSGASGTISKGKTEFVNGIPIQNKEAVFFNNVDDRYAYLLIGENEDFCSDCIKGGEVSFENSCNNDNFCGAKELFMEEGEYAIVDGKKLKLIDVNENGMITVEVDGEKAYINPLNKKIIKNIEISNFRTFFDEKSATLYIYENIENCPNDCLEEELICNYNGICDQKEIPLRFGNAINVSGILVQLISISSSGNVGISVDNGVYGAIDVFSEGYSRFINGLTIAVKNVSYEDNTATIVLKEDNINCEDDCKETETAGKIESICNANTLCEYNAYILDMDETVVHEGRYITLRNVGSNGAISIDVSDDVTAFTEVLGPGVTEIVSGLSITNKEYFFDSDGNSVATITVGEDSYSCPNDCLIDEEEAICDNNGFCSGAEIYLKVGDLRNLNGKIIKLIGVGFYGAIIVGVDGTEEVIEPLDSADVNGIIIQNFRTFYQDKSATLILSENYESCPNDCGKVVVVRKEISVCSENDICDGR